MLCYCVHTVKIYRSRLVRIVTSDCRMRSDRQRSGKESCPTVTQNFMLMLGFRMLEVTCHHGRLLTEKEVCRGGSSKTNSSSLFMIKNIRIFTDLLLASQVQIIFKFCVLRHNLYSSPKARDQFYTQTKQQPKHVILIISIFRILGRRWKVQYSELNGKKWLLNMIYFRFICDGNFDLLLSFPNTLKYYSF
jgi:hypothetical protein